MGIGRLRPRGYVKQTPLVLALELLIVAPMILFFIFLVVSIFLVVTA